jgi:hypothetical protein
VIHYVDTSAALKLLVEEPESADLAAALDAATRSGDRLVASMLLFTNCIVPLDDAAPVSHLVGDDRSTGCCWSTSSVVTSWRQRPRGIARRFHPPRGPAS